MFKTSIDWGLRVALWSYVGGLKHTLQSHCEEDKVNLGELWGCGICSNVGECEHNGAIAPEMIKYTLSMCVW